MTDKQQKAINKIKNQGLQYVWSDEEFLNFMQRIFKLVSNINDISNKTGIPINILKNLQ